MKKLILSSLIVTMLFFGGTANAGLGPAAVAITATTTLTFAVASAAALLLITAGGGFAGVEIANFLTEETGNLKAFLFGLGILALNENRQVVEFKLIDPSNASKYGLTEKDATVYNEGLPEINLALDELSKRRNGEMTKEQAITAYNEVATDVGLSSGARSVLSKVFVHALTEKQSK